MVEKREEQIEHSAVRGNYIVSTAADFFRLEAAGGILLVIMAILALFIANSDLYSFYNHVLNEIDFRIGFSDPGDFDFELKKSILLWINDGLMAIFFFLIGLEIKREMVDGKLSTRKSLVLPLMAAVGGIIFPALFYWFLNQDNPAALNGWAIPAATDIAFALGVLSLLKSRVPVSLKVLVTAIAVIDDLAAIMIIAIFYSGGLAYQPLVYATIAVLALFLLNRNKVYSTVPYVLIAIVLWIAVLKSGVHATLAGVVAALFIPMRTPDGHSPCAHLEHSLHPWVAFGVLPIFAFANAGVPFAGMGLADFLNPVSLGIAGGLFVGKQIGIFGIIVAVIKLGFAQKPENATWTQLYGASLLCGIGFTMSLFIGGLAFDAVEMQAAVRIGVLMGSFAAAIVGYLVLRFGPTNKHPQDYVI